MKIFIIILAILIGIFILDQLGLWLERKGWLYYRHKKPDVSGGIGNIMQELQLFLNPSVRHTLKAKQEQIIENPQDDDKNK